MKFTLRSRHGGEMAYYIVTYDIVEERVNKIRKILKKYLIWVQNSVFEGELSDAKLQKCINELLKIINKEEDSIYFYKLENQIGYEKRILGLEKNLTDNIF